MSGHVMLTMPEGFARAGEAYFDHETPPRWVIFQATARAAGTAGAGEGGGDASANFAMYVAELRYGAGAYGGPPVIVGIEEPIEVSPIGSANTCGWFDPRDAGRVLFGSTMTPPVDGEASGYSRDRSRYRWQFHNEMRVVTRRVGGRAGVSSLFELPGGPGYAAECSWSPDGRHVLYTYRDPRTKNPDIWVWDSKTDRHTALVTAPGYNGGGFFVPAGPGPGGVPRPWAIVYRSDRRGDSQLQLYMATLAYGDAGDPARITGIGAERALTDNADVNWAPFAHPSGTHLVFASSREGHSNYEVYALAMPTKADLEAPAETWPARRAALASARVTHAPGFDGLPAFSADGSWIIWTSQRAGPRAGETRASSQVWVARYTPPAAVGGAKARPGPPGVPAR